jgi:hypothetical protein
VLHGTAKFKSNLTFKLEHNCDCHTVVLISVSDSADGRMRRTGTGFTQA